MITVEYENNMNVLFRINGCRSGVYYDVCLPDQKTFLERRSMYTKKRVAANFTKLCMKKSQKVARLNLEAKEYFFARAKGYLPARYNVHHKCPLSCGGQNLMNNLIITDKQTHVLFHKYVWDKIVAILKKSQTKESERLVSFRVLVPQMPSFLTKDDWRFFMSKAEIEEEKARERKSLDRMWRSVYPDELPDRALKETLFMPRTR